MCAEPALRTENLRKEYGSKVAVAGLSLEVERGEVFGFLGPNGAGKTTSVKMFLGLVKPTSGQGWLLGAPLGDEKVRAQVGFLPEHFRFHDWLTAAEFLHLHADLYYLPVGIARKRIPELLERVGLADHRNNKLGTFSKGMLQRIGLAQALLNEPSLIFLDEPTSGLDPMGRRLVREILRELRKAGATIFLNSHLLSEVEVTCDRVAFIKQGEVVQVAVVNSMKDGDIVVEIRAQGLDQAILSGLQEFGNRLSLDGEWITIVLPRESLLPEVNQYLVSHGVQVFSLTPRRSSLEDQFIEIVGPDVGL